jgi:FMN reductase
MVNILALGGTLRPNSRSYIALQIAAQAASQAGAEVEILSLYELDLPMYKPDTALSDYGDNVQQLIEAIRHADGLLISTGAYHGTLAGATKNALDFVEFASGDERPYFHNRAVGLITVAGGEMAAAHTLTTLIHTVHALRGMVVPMTIPIMQGGKKISDGKLKDSQTQARLEKLGQETVRIASAFNVAVVAL